MEPEFHEEWRRLEDAARARLEIRPRREGLRAGCQALVLPSFEDCAAYTLLVPRLNGTGSPRGVKRIWRRTHDLAKFENPIVRLKYGPRLEPTMDEQEVALSPESVNDILARAAVLRVPARIPVNVLGTDGVTHVLTFGERLLASRFQWWGDPPSGWEGLHALLETAVKLMDSGLTQD